MTKPFLIELSYEGDDADRGHIDFYDVAIALVGFQRTLALTAHLVLNNEIIVQAPSLRGAYLHALPAEVGSWKWLTAVTVASSALYGAGTAERNTVLGHLVFSAYDYVIKQSIGVHVDFNKSLGQQLDEARAKNQKLAPPNSNRFDSLIEKCEAGLKDIHRPITQSKTATVAHIGPARSPKERLSLDENTFDFLQSTARSDKPKVFFGRVTSFNNNTFKGRIYIATAGRPIPFEIPPTVRKQRLLKLFTSSLQRGTLQPSDKEVGVIRVEAFVIESKTGLLKRLIVSSASSI